MTPKLGLALSSGAARGLAHVGVIDVLEREGVHIDMLAGTSAGALIGALYARRPDAAYLREIVNALSSRRFSLLTDLGLPKTGLIRGKRLKEKLRTIIGDIGFDELSIPFACIATDIITGEEVVIREGSVVDAVRASTSIPGMFSVARLDGRLLVDGGLVNPVPVRVLRDMGAELIIAVNVVPDLRRRSHLDETAAKEELKEPNIFNVMLRTLHIAGYQAVRSSLEGADVVIEPKVVHIGFGDFHRVKECLLLGEMAAEHALPEIKRKLDLYPKPGKQTKRGV